ncbi:MAG: 23S rRNA (adenine(2030)-N(6))-methyltransferase RlmJ [Gammaproteobacteria bacterium]|nr:23S rRNA (adenine(2030)-N(6))-methyltransferase RlmJ [Gammaproteobacteria bacterium]
MLSYQHAYHAGGFADVLKHAVLALVADYLVRKDKPLLYLDTHAGAGLYDLRGTPARKGMEFTTGIGALWPPVDAPAVLRPYLDVVGKLNPGATLTRYPGSPWLARALLRRDDRLELHELHPAEHEALAANFAGDRRVHVHHADGLHALRARLPPQERRALVLVDPSYELAADYRRVPAAIAAALTRFATGTYLLWYPLRAQAPHRRMLEALAALAPRDALRAEIEIAAPATAWLYGCGLVVVNPPWPLRAQLDILLPALATRLGGHDGRYRAGALAD